MKEEEIISIAVCCFNSSMTVIETLESIKNQTYGNLELLINDDGSVDNTVDVIKIWLEKNSNRFVNIVFHVNIINKGINWSFDYILRQCRTKWCKFIAADDLLLPNCISDNLHFIKKNGINTLLYSIYEPFMIINDNCVNLKCDEYDIDYATKIAEQDVKNQYISLLRKDMVFSPTGFINVELYKQLGGISLKIKNIEDWPLRLLFVSHNQRIYFMKKKTVRYRIGNSVSHSKNNYYNESHIKQRYLVKQVLVYPNIPKYNIGYYFCEYMTVFRYWLIIKIFNNKKTFSAKIVNYMLMLFDRDKLSKFCYLIKNRKVVK